MMDAKKKLVPKRRFKEFIQTNDWELCKLAELAEFNPRSSLPEEFEYVDLESVVGTELVSHRTENKLSAPSRAQRLAKKEDVFYQTVRPYQKNNYLFDLPYDNYVFSTGYAQLRPKNDGYFLLTLLQEDSFVNRVLERSTGTSYPAINSNDLAKLSVRVPFDKEEQARIGIFFKQLDNTIALHQRKLEKMKDLKLAYLTEMFPAEGESKPKRRFAGFTDDWEQHKLGELLESFYQGINTAADKVVYSENGVEILQSKHITGGKISFYEVRHINKEKYPQYFPKYVPQIGDILFSNIGTIGPSTVVKIKKEFLIAWNILKMTPNNYGNSNFIQLQFQHLNNKKFFSTITTGNATKFVNKDVLSNVEIEIPKKEEQIMIVDFFSKLDDTIDLHQRRLEKLRDIKKAYLNEMLV